MSMGHQKVTHTKPLPMYGFLWVCGGARLPDCHIVLYYMLRQYQKLSLNFQPKKP